MIIGDLNADLLKLADAESRAFLNLVENHSLKIIKYGATHHTRMNTTNFDTHIDVILVDTQERLLNFDKFPIPYAGNGHALITATFVLFVVEPFIAPFRYCDYRGIRSEAFFNGCLSVVRLVRLSLRYF